MNSTLTEMLHRTTQAEMSVLERQQARLKFQSQQNVSVSEQLQQSYFSDTQFNLMPNQGLMSNEMAIRELVNRSIKMDPAGLENGWPDFAKYPLSGAGFGSETTGFGSVENGYGGNGVDLVDYSLSRTSSCPTAMLEGRSVELGLSGKIGSVGGRESVKKRKVDKAQNSKVAAEEIRNKRMKGDSEEESKITEQNNSNSSISNNNNKTNNKETSADSVKEKSKASGDKSDYIHVRARRGQATDSHSLAERVRREKISERMKYLQDLVPGCNKITGKAGMLDEIINYVQSLQRQVEFLSMKLATVNPRLDFNIESLFTKESFPSSTSFPIGTAPELSNCAAYLPFNSLQQMVSSCGSDMAMSSSELALQRTRSAPLPDAFIDTSCFTQTQPSSTWETDLQNLYNVEFNQGRSPAFPPQSFTGILEANNLKMEM
ncbi:hypothetical protein IFM89_007231 [Coptis chinensis]|uniref:BHLH domain-containing protein n=1 Tax=Coptis chinensis TaxID=261450 RepID=A0A835IPU5_9MAGN|nr:hypothetical protein IFM89_007231 [Coptis chinensis]